MPDMKDSSSPDEESKDSSREETPKAPEDVFADITGDDIFSFKISEDMVLRNMLRSGLVEAQGKDTDKIPMYISWPNWLDDGIVCLFVKDFHEVLHRAIKDIIISLNNILGVEGLNIESDVSIEEQDYESETVPDSESEIEQEKIHNGDSIEADSGTYQEESETDAEQETVDTVQESTPEVEEEEKTEEPRKIAPGQHLTDELSEEFKKGEEDNFE